MPLPLVLAGLVGAAAALAGGFWDDAWHTDRGRDAFLIAPHIAIYAGVALIGAALAVRIIVVLRRAGAAAVLGDRQLLLAAASVAVTLASAPIDNSWHRAFGRDAVLWSPPHMLGIAGTLALGAALLAGAGSRKLLGPVVGALVMAAASFPVAEYETDVPQFAAVWYLPALALGTAVAFALVTLTAGDRGWPRTRAAAVHLLFMLAVSGFLLAAGFGAPQLALLLVPALAADRADAWAWPRWAGALAVTATLYAAYVPARDLLGHGIRIDAFDVLVGFPLAFGAIWVVSLLTARPARPSARAVVTAMVVLFGLPTATAAAHDPGQGEPAGRARLSVVGDTTTVAISGALLDTSCGDVTSGQLVARRAGDALRAPLVLDGCAFRGRATVGQRGRWFVYADLLVAGRTVETWLPVKVGDGRRRVAEARRYVYVVTAMSGSVLKLVGGAAIYAVVAALVIAALVLVRPARERAAA